MNYLEILDYLKSRDMTMSRYEREDWDAFAKRINLSLSVPYIQLTGSNGKGSTANDIYQIYLAHGYKVALFSKPYFDTVREMMQISGKMISETDFARIFNAQAKEIQRSNLSSFEIETYIAFAYFNEQKPDLAIIECGMGGATDSTNLAWDTPLLSIITTISLEHTAFLGRTLSEIAYNKGGIIKDKAPLLVGHLDEAAGDVLKELCRNHQSDYLVADDYHNETYDAPYYRFDYRPYKGLQILTPAHFQLDNAAIAIEATNLLMSRFPLSEFDVRNGLKSNPLPCRMERHHNVIIDGAHNPEAINALMDSMVTYASGKPIHVLFAAYRDKNIAVELPRLSRDAQEVILTTFDAERARKESDYFLYEGDYRFEEDYKAALSSYLVSYPDDIILVCGSLAFANVIRHYVVEELKL
jgi:dihydrofolate synthase / folylpolyglutamate synthase